MDTGGEIRSEWQRLVDDVLKATNADVVNIPFPGKPDGVRFSTLYLDRTLLAERKQSAYETDSPGHEGERLRGRMQREVLQEVAKAEVVEIWQELQREHRIWVEAVAWTGKTTLCKHIAQRCHDQKAWLPIFVSFRDFSGSGKSIQRYLDQDYSRRLKMLGRTVVDLPTGGREEVSVGTWLYRQWISGQALLILDGADEEFDRTKRQYTFGLLPSSAAETARSRILLTSRPLGEPLPTRFKRLTLKELDLSQIEKLVRSCGKVMETPEAAERFVQELLRPDSGRSIDLASRPGNLVEMFWVFLQKGQLLTRETDIMDHIANRRFGIA